jgi:hypothetical protein
MVAQAERRGQRGRRFVALLTALGILSGCSVFRALDFGGDDKNPVEFYFGWQHGVEQSKAKPGQVDAHGVYQPETPEVDAILGFPNIHAGLAGEIRPDPRITPVVAVELCRMKFPYVRWWELQVGAGAQLIEASFTKRLISVFEVTAGPWIG